MRRVRPGLYPAFFELTVDDTERAAILLHESYHFSVLSRQERMPGATLPMKSKGSRQPLMWLPAQPILCTD